MREAGEILVLFDYASYPARHLLAIWMIYNHVIYCRFETISKRMACKVIGVGNMHKYVLTCLDI